MIGGRERQGGSKAREGKKQDGARAAKSEKTQVAVRKFENLTSIRLNTR
jgi:hypothetical protein